MTLRSHVECSADKLREITSRCDGVLSLFTSFPLIVFIDASVKLAVQGMSHQTEFEIVSEAPHVDKVLFDNVLSCYDWSKKLTATYTLGEALSYTTWDWVGIFRCNWRFLSDYVSYRWAPHKTTDCTAPRRRSIAFPAEIHLIRPDEKDEYQFIYVSSGNRVTGVSSPFKIWKEVDLDSYDLVQLFPSLSFKGNSKPVKRKAESTKQPPSSGPEHVETAKPSHNQKVLQIYRNKHSLVDFTGTEFQNKFRILEYQPIVKEYSALTTTDVGKQLAPVKHASQTADCSDPLTSEVIDSNSNILPCFRQKYMNSIEFRHFLPIKTGPKSFLLSLQLTPAGCPNCLIAKDLIREFIEKEDLHTRKLYDLNRKDTQLYRKDESPNHADMLNSVDFEMVCKLQKENCALRDKVRDLGEKIEVSKIESQSDWVVFEPKRIYRLNKLVVKQGKIICELAQSIEDKSKALTNYKDETLTLKKMLKSADDRNKYFKSLADELNWKLKCLISNRAKERQNEWANVAKKVEDTETQTFSPDNLAQQPSCSEPIKAKKIVKNKQISKILCAEKKQPKTRLHKERHQAEQCPTCGLKFSLNADARVIEEHLVFHDRKEK